MVKITRVWTTQLYQNEHLELPEELLIEHFGSVEAFLRGPYEGSVGFDQKDWPDDFVEALNEYQGEIVRRESKWDSEWEYHPGQVVKVDRWIYPHEE